MATMVQTNPVSCHLITWGQDLETGMREASELGYRACETFTQHALAYEGRVDEYKQTLASHNLRLSALYAGGSFGDASKRQEVIEFNERVARFLAAVGVDRIVFGPGRFDGKPGPDDLRRIAETINEAAKRTFQLGVLACVHPHLGTEIEGQEEIDAVMELTDPEVVFLCPDTAQQAGAGVDPAQLIRTYGSRMRYMHIKDLTPESPDPSVFANFTGTEALPIFCELGLGTIDLPGVMAAVREVGYDGWITVEIDQSTSTPYQSLATCRDYARNVLGLDLSVTPA